MIASRIAVRAPAAAVPALAQGAGPPRADLELARVGRQGTSTIPVGGLFSSWVRPGGLVGALALEAAVRGEASRCGGSRREQAAAVEGRPGSPQPVEESE